MNYRQLILFIVLIVLAVLLTLRECNISKHQAALELQQRVLTDSLTVTTNKLGEQTATIGLISTDFATFQKLTFAEKDSLGRALQKLVTKRTISATIATQVMVIDTVLQTDTVYYVLGDTCNPVYTLNDSTHYRTMYIEARRDSFSVRMKAFETLTFTQEWSKWRPFKKQTCLTNYTNSNPDVNITGLRTFTVQCDCSKKGWMAFGFGNITGSLLGFGGGYLYGRGSK